MTSVLNVDTIADKAGTGPVGLTKQTAPRAWMQINMLSTATIEQSLNTSSLTDEATGKMAVGLTNAFDAATYCNVNGGGGEVNNGTLACMATPANGKTASQIKVEAVYAHTTGVFDAPECGIACIGDLA